MKIALSKALCGLALITFVVPATAMIDKPSLIGKDATAQGQINWHNQATRNSGNNNNVMQHSKSARFGNKSKGISRTKDEYTRQGQYNWYQVR